MEYCEACIDTKKRAGKIPPCRECEYGHIPELFKVNLDAWELWLAVQTQWRAGGFGIIGLDYQILYEMAKRMEIDVSRCTLKKIQALERHELEKQSLTERTEDTEKGF